MRELDRFIRRRLLERFTVVLLVLVCLLALGGYALAATPLEQAAPGALACLTPATAMHPGRPR